MMCRKLFCDHQAIKKAKISTRCYPRYVFQLHLQFGEASREYDDVNLKYPSVSITRLAFYRF